MATAEALQRLQGLVQRLLPLSDARAGEPIRAEDWNTLVGALIDVARVALTEAGTVGAVPPHDHPDQVKLSWLDPALRESLGRGGLGGPGADTRATRAVLDLDRLRRRFEDVGVEVATLRDKLTATTSRDLVREADFTQLRRDVGQVSGSGADDLLLLRRQLEDVSGEVKRAVGAADRLTVNGELVDVGGLVAKVAAVERLRDALTLPTGEILTAARLEQRLSELTNTLVTESELDTALRDRRVELAGPQLDALTDRLSSEVRTRVATDFDTLRQELAARTDERLAGVGATITRQIEEASPGLRSGVELAVQERLTAELAEVRATILAESARQIEATAGRLRSELTKEVDGVRASIGAAVDASLREQMPARIAEFEGRLASLAGRLDGTDSGFKRVDAALGSVTGRIGDLTTELRGSISTVQTRLTNELTGIRAEIGTTRSDFDGKLAATETRVGTRLEARIAETSRTFDQKLDATRIEVRDRVQLDTIRVDRVNR